MGLFSRLFGRPESECLDDVAGSDEQCPECYGTHTPLPSELSAYDPPFEWCEAVKEHKRNGRYDEALAILDKCISVEEAHSGGVAPWYYEQTAIIHRKSGDRDAEIAVLRRFAAQPHAAGASPPKLLERLAKLEAAN